MSPADLAQLALSLKGNEAFQATLDRQRSDALERLATMKRDDDGAFYTNQAIVAVIDTIRADLEAFVLAGQPKKPPGIA